MTDSDTDSDILEATVHGTQDACKKEAIIIKTEVDSASDSEDSISEVIRNTIQYDLTKIPLVYTTRLDDMNAFSKRKGHSCKEVSEKILAQSKPRYVQRNEQISQMPLNNILRISYIQLCSHVQQLNINAKIEAREKIAKKLKMCKPFKITLTDIKKTTGKAAESKRFLDNTTSTCHDEDDDDLLVPVIYSSDEDLPLSVHRRTPATEIIRNQKTTVAIRQNQSQEADIYILHKGLISYYRINFTEYNYLHRAHRSQKLVLLQYCCWVKREESIKNLMNTNLLTPSDASFMKNPHNCEPKLCVCCCALKFPVPTECNDFKANSSNLQPTVEISKPNNLIERAFEYTPEEADVIKEQVEFCQKAESECYLKCAVIIMKYIAYRVVFEQTKLLGEYYLIGNNGMLESYIKPTTNRTYKDEIVYFKKCISKHDIPTRYLQQLICCWYKREEVLACMRKRDNLSPNVIRFIRSPHLCKYDTCKCCCKPKMNTIRLENVTIQKRSNLFPSLKTLSVNDLIEQSRTTEQSNKNNSTEKQLPFTNNNESSDVTLEPPVNIPNKQLIKHTTNKTISRANRKTIGKNKQNTIIRHIIDLTDEAPVVPEQSRSNSKCTPNSEFVDISNLQNCSSDPPPNANDIPYTVAINNISLKDLKLSVNNGKLTATINARPECLNSVELKVLSDILAHASRQINQLGLTPENFCKRVNSVRAANLNTLMSNQLNQAQAAPAAHAAVANSATNLNSFISNKVSPSVYNVISDPHVPGTKPNCDQSKFVRVNLKPSTTPPITRRFKAYHMSESIPKTSNKSNLSGSYQNMSCLGGNKAMHLMHAYWVHCQSLFKSQNAYVKTFEIPEMVYSIPDNSNTKPNINTTEVPATNRLKRKTFTEITPTNTQKKIRVKSPTELIEPMITTSRPPPLVSTNNKKKVVKHKSKKIVTSIEHNQTPFFANLPRDTQAAVLNKQNEPERSENSPMLNKMLSYESMPPLVPIRLEAREPSRNSQSRQRSQPYIKNLMHRKNCQLGTYTARTDRPQYYYHGHRKLEDKKKAIAAASEPEKIKDTPASKLQPHSVMDLVVFTDDAEDGIFGA